MYELLLKHIQAEFRERYGDSLNVYDENFIYGLQRYIEEQYENFTSEKNTDAQVNKIVSCFSGKQAKQIEIFFVDLINRQELEKFSDKTLKLACNRCLTQEIISEATEESLIENLQSIIKKVIKYPDERPWATKEYFECFRNIKFAANRTTLISNGLRQWIQNNY